MKSKCLLRCVGLLMLWLPMNQVCSQDIRKPDPISGAPTFNAFVESCFALYGNTTSVKTRVDAVQTDLASKAVTDINPDKMLAELGDCKSLLGNLAPAVASLLTSSGDVVTKVKDEIGTNPFKIISALKQIKNSVKALKQSQENITALLSLTIPGVKGKLKEKTGVDTTDKTTGGNTTQAPTLPSTTDTKPVTATTTVTVDNIVYGTAQAMADTLKTYANVKSVTKTYGANKAVFTVEHTGTTDELLEFIMHTGFGKKSDVLELNAGQIKLKTK